MAAKLISASPLPGPIILPGYPVHCTTFDEIILPKVLVVPDPRKEVGAAPNASYTILK